MFRKIKTFRVAVLGLCLSISLSSFAADSAELEKVDAMIDKALTAYNNKDWKTFYADWAETMSSIATEQSFNALYTGMYHNNFGQYKSRVPIPAETVLSGDSPVGLIVYTGVFEKNEKVKISVNVIREKDSWKIMQIQFAAME